MTHFLREKISGRCEKRDLGEREEGADDVKKVCEVSGPDLCPTGRKTSLYHLRICPPADVRALTALPLACSDKATQMQIPGTVCFHEECSIGY